MGYKLAGYEVIGVCEIDKEINDVYLRNFKPKYNYLMGVQDFKNEKEIPEELYNLDILDGSPPCSTFSLAGEREKNWGKEKKFREGQAKQILDDLFFEFLDVAEKLKPKIIVAENVKGMLVGNAKGYINLIVKRFNEIGYDVQIFLLNAALMGVPQRSERVFFIARRNDLNLKPIVLKFNEKPILYGEYKDNDYIPLNKDTTTYKRWLRRATKDNTIGDTVQRTEGGKISGFTTVYVKDNITPYTQTASTRQLRFDVPGFMSDRDVLITQSFPVDYNCDGKYILDKEKLIICQSNAKTEDLQKEYPNAIINPLGDWTGGTNVDSGATNRKLGSDMAQSVTGGGLHGKDLSKADVSVNIYAFLKAQQIGRPVELCCAIGDKTIDGRPYSEIVNIAKKYIKEIGGFEKFAEWGLF